MLHDLWEDEPSEGWTVCLTGPMGDAARASLSPRARLVRTVEAASHYEAMTRHYEHMGWGVYTTDFPEVGQADVRGAGLGVARHRASGAG